jgi:hypothetical protein
MDRMFLFLTCRAVALLVASLLLAIELERGVTISAIVK